MKITLKDVDRRVLLVVKLAKKLRRSFKIRPIDYDCSEGGIMIGSWFFGYNSYGQPFKFGTYKYDQTLKQIERKMKTL